MFALSLTCEIKLIRESNASGGLAGLGKYAITGQEQKDINTSPEE